MSLNVNTDTWWKPELQRVTTGTTVISPWYEEAGEPAHNLPLPQCKYMKFPEADTMNQFWLFLLTIQTLSIKLLLQPMKSVQTYDALWPLQNAY